MDLKIVVELKVLADQLYGPGCVTFGDGCGLGEFCFIFPKEMFRPLFRGIYGKICKTIHGRLLNHIVSKTRVQIYGHDHGR